MTQRDEFEAWFAKQNIEDWIWRSGAWAGWQVASAEAMEDCDARIRKWREAFDAMHRRAMKAETSIKEAINIIETYQVSVGNSAAGEIACEMTMASLGEIRDSIRALAQNQEKP